MKHIYLAGLIVFAMAACTDKKTKLFNEIKNLEQSEEIMDDAASAKIAILKSEYGMLYKDSLANSFLFSAAMHYYYTKEKQKASEMLEEYLTRDDSSSNAVLAIYHLAYLEAEEENYAEMEAQLNRAMEIASPNKNQYAELIKIYRKKINDRHSITLSDYERLASYYGNIGLIEAAVQTLDSAIALYPDNPRRGDLLQRAGFLCETELNEAKLAEAYYKQFLAEYPNHPLAKDVKTVLDNGYLYMTPEEQLQHALKNKNNPDTE